MTIPLVHQTKYQVNPNYVTIVKQDLDKLLSASFIAPMEEVSWLSPIVVSKKNGKLKIYMDFQWLLNVATKKDPYPLPFTEEVLDEMAGHEVYSFLDGFCNYYHIMITLENKYKTTFIIDWGAFFGWSCHLGSRMFHQLINRWWV